MERNSFTFYRSFASALIRIKSKTARCAAYDAICAYALDGIEPDLDALPASAAIAFLLIRPTLDAANKRAESGRIGGLNSTTRVVANGKQIKSKPEANAERNEREKEGENEEEGEKEKESDSYTRACGFVKPTLEEVAAYCAERGNSVDPEHWYAHYASNGWHVGKNQMMDWQAAVRTWEHNGMDQPQAPKSGKADSFAQLWREEKEKHDAD